MTQDKMIERLNKTPLYTSGGEQSDLPEVAADALKTMQERLAATEAEHQDFRLQNDKEWRAKIDYQKARVAELEYALETETRMRKDQDRRLEAAEARVAELTDKVEGLEADLDSAVEVAFWHGATEWTRLNYPKQFAALKCG